jgi:hypothetical protein
MPLNGLFSRTEIGGKHMQRRLDDDARRHHVLVARA